MRIIVVEDLTVFLGNCLGSEVLLHRDGIICSAFHPVEEVS